MKTVLDFPPAALSRGRFFPEMAAASSASAVTRLWPSLGGVLGVLDLQFVDDNAALASFFRRLFSTFRRSFATDAAPDCVPSPSILPSQQYTRKRTPDRLWRLLLCCGGGTTSKGVEIPPSSLQNAFSSYKTPFFSTIPDSTAFFHQLIHVTGSNAACSSSSSGAGSVPFGAEGGVSYAGTIY